MNRQLESTTKIKVLWLTVRVWRTESDLSKVNNDDLFDLGDMIAYEQSQARDLFISANDVAERYEKLPRVAAVEVTNEYGSGVLIYPDWN